MAELSGTSFTVTSPIVINLTTSSTGPIGIDLGGAKIVSQITNGAPVIEIIVARGVNVSSLSLSNFMIQGNGLEGAGIKIVADGADRSVKLNIDAVNVEHVGGIGIDAIGNVSGTVFDSWMHGNLSGGARFASSASGGTADGLEWIGGGFRKNGVAGLILDNGSHDMTVQGAYFVENQGPGLYATSGVTLVEQSGFENNAGVGALVMGAATFVNDTFSTYGVQQTAIGGYLSGQQITLIGTGNEYYGGNPDNTVLSNVQGIGTLSLAGRGKVVASPAIAMTGLTDLTTVQPPADTTSPVVTSITTSGLEIVAGTGTLGAGKTVTLTATFSEAVTVSGGVPSLQLDDGGTATYVGGSGTTALTFTYTVQGGQNTPDLAVSSLGLNGAAIKDVAGNSAVLSGAATNPAGILRIDTLAPTVSSIAATGPGITSGSGTLHAGDTVTFTVLMSEAVTVAGAPTLFVSSGAMASYVGGSDGNTLNFSYTVEPGQTAVDLMVSSLNLNGGSIKDNAGNAADVSGASNYNPEGQLTVDTTSVSTAPPKLTATLVSDTGASSTDGITSNAGITGTAAINSIVHFIVDGQAIAQTASTDVNGIWTLIPPGLADGQHMIVASQTNSGGATGTVSLAFTLDRTAPSPTFTSITAANGKVTLAGVSGSGDQLSVFDGITQIGSTTAGSDGHWTFTAGAAPKAAHNYAIKAADFAGNEGWGSGHALLGSSGADALTGSTGPDLIVGGNGNDKIIGGAGNDVLTGGGGTDTFLFNLAPGPSNLDKITDFKAGTDKLGLSQSVFTTLPAGNLASSAFVNSIAPLTPAQHLIYNQSSGLLSYDADGSGAGPLVGVVQLTPGQALSPQDIVVI